MQTTCSPSQPSALAVAPAATLMDAVAADALDRRIRQGALASRVYEVAQRTPLESAPRLGAECGVRVLLKREDLQPVHSFKLRGAYQRMCLLTSAERARGVVAASAGNHAQGVALAAARLGVHAILIMPTTTAHMKIDAVRSLGGDHVEVMLAGRSYTDAQDVAARLVAERGYVFVHPFDDPDVIAGQATVGAELMQQWREPVHAVFVPVGGGGLLAGIACVLKSRFPHVKVIGVQAADSDAMARSLEAGRAVALDEVGLFSDGTAVRRVGECTLALCRRHVDAMLRVDTDAICAAIGAIHRETRCVPEPAGALAVAGLRQYAAAHAGIHGALVAVVSGANMDFERLGYIAAHAASTSAEHALSAATGSAA